MAPQSQREQQRRNITSRTATTNIPIGTQDSCVSPEAEDGTHGDLGPRFYFRGSICSTSHRERGKLVAVASISRGKTDFPFSIMIGLRHLDEYDPGQK